MSFMEIKFSWYNYELCINYGINVYETIEWNYTLKVVLSFKFYFILFFRKDGKSFAVGFIRR